MRRECPKLLASRSCTGECPLPASDGVAFIYLPPRKSLATRNLAGLIVRNVGTIPCKAFVPFGLGRQTGSKCNWLRTAKARLRYRHRVRPLRALSFRPPFEFISDPQIPLTSLQWMEPSRRSFPRRKKVLA
jgi:hypothetical protein